MLIYYFFFFLVTFASALLYYNGKSKSLKGYADKKPHVNVRGFLSFFLLLIFIGTRYNVGRDYSGYANNIRYLTSKANGFEEMSFEYGSDAIMWIARQLGSPQWYFFLTTLILLFFLYKILKKNGSPLFGAMTIISFMLCELYVFDINTIRQGIAMMVFFYALMVVDFNNISLKNFFKYTLFILLGTLLHSSCLFLLPFYFLLNDKILRNIPGWFLAAIILFGFIGNFLGISAMLNYDLIETIAPAYAFYMDMDIFEGESFTLGIGGLIILAFKIFPLFWYKDMTTKIPEYRKFFFLYALGTSLVYIFSGNMLLSRMAQYLSFAFVLAFPMFICYLNRYDKGMKAIIIPLFIAFFCLTNLNTASLFFKDQVYSGATVFGIQIK